MASGEPCRAWLEQHKQQPLPVVQFAGGVRRAIGPHKWDMKVNAGRTLLARVQLPLMHAWALTIHKCQGAHAHSHLNRVVPRAAAAVSPGSQAGCGQPIEASAGSLDLQGVCFGSRRPYKECA